MSVGFIVLHGSAYAVGVAPAILDLQGHGGQEVERTVTVINTSDAPRSFTSSVQSFTPGEDGSPIFDGGSSAEPASWFSVEPPIFTLFGNTSESVRIRLVIPEGARPGDFYQAVFFQEEGERVTSSAALLVFLTVTGPEIRESAEIVAFSAGPGSLFRLEDRFIKISVQNSGNVYLKPEGNVRVRSWLGQDYEVPLNPEGRRVLPGSTRTWDLSLLSENISWRFAALGPVTVQAQMRLGDRVLDKAQTVVWAVSGNALLILLILLSLFFFVFYRRRCHRVWNVSSEKLESSPVSR